MNQGIRLLLGTAFLGCAGAARQAEPVPAEGPSPPSTRPVTTAPAGPSSAAAHRLTTRELEEHLRLITAQNTPEARELGARSLLRDGSEEAVRRLVRVLGEPHDLAAEQAVCRAIARLAGSPDPALIEPLLGLLGLRPAELDGLLVLALRRFDSDRVVPRLRAIAGSGAVELPRRKAAVRALGEMGEDLKAVEALIDVIRAGEPGLRGAALEALSAATGVRHPDAASALAWWEPHRRMTPLAWLSEVGARRLDEINRLRAENDGLVRRLVTAYREAYLRTPESDRPDRLLAFLGDGTAAVRGLGLDLINTLITDRKEVGDRTQARLVEMITDPDPRVRRDVATIVGDLRPAGALEGLQAALAVEAVARVRASQVAALGGLDDPRAIPVLIGRLEDRSEEVVAEAATALGMLARRGQADAETAESVSGALLRRFDRIDAEETVLRQRHLEALARIGSESARPVFIREMAEPRSVRIRRTAISGLASFEDAAAADQVRPSVTSAEMEVRLAAVSALGRCGRGREDLEALMERLDAGAEPSPVVRDEAWASYLKIVRRMPAQSQLAAAGLFARPGDATAQRRRLEVLKGLETNAEHRDALSFDERLGLLEALADARSELGEYAAAAGHLEEALGLLGDADHPRFEEMGARLVTALLLAGRDEDAIAGLNAMASHRAPAGDGRAASPLAEAILGALRGRLETAKDAGQFAALSGLIEGCEPVAGRFGGAFARTLGEIEAAAEKRRVARVVGLLEGLGDDPTADTKLLAFGSEVVLPQVHALLRGPGTASAPAPEHETELIGIARRLAPDWPGYRPGCPEAERAAALDKLEMLFAPVSSGPAATTRPATAPAATRP